MMMRLKRLLFLFILITAVLMGSGCLGEDDPVARVNDKTITRNELDRFINLMRLFNPDLDSVIESHQEGFEMRKVEMEFLQILIDVELVKQEADRLSLFIDRAVLDQKSEALAEGLVRTHYGNSSEHFHKRRKQLKLSLDDLLVIPHYELQLQALFDFVSLTLTDDDLLQYAEENPELLRQAASLNVYRISYADEHEANLGLEKLQQGMPLEEYIFDIQDRIADLETGTLGWITQEDPFVETNVKELLFSLPQGSMGGIIKMGERYTLYWVREVKPEMVLKFEEAKEQVFLRKQYILYQDYFNALWSEGEIEILLHSKD
jgi:hypothetical protein